MRDFIAQRKYTFPVGVDTDRAIYSLYATEYLPRCFVIDPFGRIVALSAEYSAEEHSMRYYRFTTLCRRAVIA